MEVLFTLFLLSTVVLGLFKQQQFNRQLLHKLMLQDDASQFLDNVTEYMLVPVPVLPEPARPLLFQKHQHVDEMRLTVDYFNATKPLERTIIQ